MTKKYTIDDVNKKLQELGDLVYNYNVEAKKGDEIGMYGAVCLAGEKIEIFKSGTSREIIGACMAADREAVGTVIEIKEQMDLRDDPETAKVRDAIDKIK